VEPSCRSPQIAHVSGRPTRSFGSQPSGSTSTPVDAHSPLFGHLTCTSATAPPHDPSPPCPYPSRRRSTPSSAGGGTVNQDRQRGLGRLPWVPTPELGRAPRSRSRGALHAARSAARAHESVDFGKRAFNRSGRPGATSWAARPGGRQLEWRPRADHSPTHAGGW